MPKDTNDTSKIEELFRTYREGGEEALRKKIREQIEMMKKPVQDETDNEAN